MKRFLIWNDLSLFFENSSFEKVEMEVNFFLNYLNAKYDMVCKYEFISSKKKMWQNILETSSNLAVFSVGTRPTKLLVEQMNFDVFPIEMFRIRNHEGENREIVINDREGIGRFLKKKEEILIYEDIIVEGKSMIELCDFLLQNFNERNITINVWYSNFNSAINLRKLYPTISFQVENYFEGCPIIESTFVCLYDLLYGKIGKIPFIENEQLLANFFFDDVAKLQTEVNNIKKELEDCDNTITKD